MKKIIKFAGRHPFWAGVILSEAIGVLLCFFGVCVWSVSEFPIEHGTIGLYLTEAASMLLSGVFAGAFLIYPVVLTAEELWMLVKLLRGRAVPKEGCVLDITAVLLGILFSCLYLEVLGHVYFDADWETQLYNAGVHTPVFTGSAPTVAAIALTGMAGYAILQWIPLRKMPPLLMVAGMAGMYLGTLLSIVWLVQLSERMSSFLLDPDWLLALLPANCVFITVRMMAQKMKEWRELAPEARWQGRHPFLQQCSRLLERSETWPVAAFLLMLPLLGILIGVLMLFGQAPDAVIKAWTETAGWALSQRVGPQNIYYDEHYLCTVAAGGHERVVKPLRMGVRHGHRVIVNRQLCVANAFEQLLEERTPRLHRTVRYVYDKYGFPVAKLIRSKYAADAVYVMMKPLEWVFLAVLYLADVNPENRIAIQYTGKRLEDFGYERA